ncbi:hypothetical protein SLS62_000779 [Diatrype stigma]|uniref:DUF6604 domain-containing protein n=1 Tax=Diatrype stigma TaxID=117547 RepID=A0AAN9UX85_9PEZI
MLPTPAASQARSEYFSNKFAALELQEPSEEFLSAPDFVRPSNAMGDDATYEMEPEAEFEDLIVALAMILPDLNRIRSHVEWRWSKYKSGFFDLTAAAIATNTATDLGRNLTEDIAPSFKPHGGTGKLTEDRNLILAFFIELLAVVRTIHDYPVQDEFMRGMKEMDRTKDVPFYLVFAAQVFLDIHHTTREYAEQGLATFKQHMDVFNDELDEHFKIHQDFKTVAQCGLMLYHFRAEMYDIGILLANIRGCIPYAVHLYNAVGHEGHMQSEWPDMDIMRVTLGDSNFFVGEAPENPETYVKKLALQMGGSLATMTDKRRRNVASFSRSEPRSIKAGAPVSCMFKDRYLYGTGQFDWTPEHVGQIIDLSMWEESGSEQDGTPILVQINDPKKIKAKKQEREKGKGKLGKKQRGTTEGVLVPPEMLVRALVFALHGESFEFSLCPSTSDC